MLDVDSMRHIAEIADAQNTRVPQVQDQAGTYPLRTRTRRLRLPQLKGNE